MPKAESSGEVDLQKQSNGVYGYSRAVRSVFKPMSLGLSALIKERFPSEGDSKGPLVYPTNMFKE